MTEHNKYYWDIERNKGVRMSKPEGYDFDTKYDIPKTWKVPPNADFAWHLDKVTEKITNLLKGKNAAYGNSALNPTNIFSKLDAVDSLCCRLDDKIARIKNKGITDETEDTVDDLIGYLLLLKMAIERKQ
tara:strand:- start:1976 stop:2365 length:390 start_codon:yes stop_codon:yes gene_type:complete